ncbi:MAG TPA: restriction endonuclease [Polyangiaceae bacterium]|nr:restriction endonuclease [Polyangiaceae bacterium]
MSGEDPGYVVDHNYRDSTDLIQNEFYTRLKVKNSGGMRPRMRADGRLAYLVLVSSHVSVATYNPWDDIIDPSQGRIWYWGDAKYHDSKLRDDWSGNRYLATIWNAINEGRFADVPPILHFSKMKKGEVTFTGLAVLKDLRDAWMEENGMRVRNYRASLDILPVDKVSLAWLQSRAESEERFVPPEWRRYAASGASERLVVHARRIRSREEQVPQEGVQRKLLATLTQLDPFAFERLVVKAFQQNEIGHEITQTRATGDGGFDFFGSFKLPPPLSYSIPLKGEVKRYDLDGGGVGPKDVARLVARLQRGEHGVFVTTSHFTRQAQDEMYTDKYPVELIPGGRFAGMLAQIGAVRGGELLPHWWSE